MVDLNPGIVTTPNISIGTCLEPNVTAIGAGQVVGCSFGYILLVMMASLVATIGSAYVGMDTTLLKASKHGADATSDLHTKLNRGVMFLANHQIWVKMTMSMIGYLVSVSLGPILSSAGAPDWFNFFSPIIMMLATELCPLVLTSSKLGFNLAYFLQVPTYCFLCTIGLLAWLPSFCFEKCFGTRYGIMLKRGEFTSFLLQHGPNTDPSTSDVKKPLSKEELRAMRGILGMRHNTAVSVYEKLDDSLMFPIEKIITKEVVLQIIQSGQNHVAFYGPGGSQNIIKVLKTKKLALIDVSKPGPLSEAVLDEPVIVEQDTPINDIQKKIFEGETICFVKDKENPEQINGFITMATINGVAFQQKVSDPDKGPLVPTPSTP